MGDDMAKDCTHYRTLFSDIREGTPFVRLIIWVNILMQFIFPLACAFTPAITYAQSHQHAVVADAEPGTRVYTLAPGESVRSVAKKYHLTVEELRKLNQFRTFAHGFSALQAGDELDVPAAPVTKKTTPAAQPTETDEQAQKVAGLASQAGSFLGSGPDGGAATSLATGMATGEASSQLQKVLSRFGTARVQVNADENFSLKNSQFDLLVPLWEQKDTLFFTQGSVHRTDDRTQSNLGFGLRHFTDDYMVGANTFLDYDLSREHRRAGLGLEYGRDYLKLSTNGYLRLSDWKDSEDVEDYQERPANGWDVRMEGWLPALPQLGGKLVYEQYYGDEVALSDKDNRQRDPHAVTLGVNYTPVPLVTLSAEQREGSSDDDDTRVGLEMNYQLGVPWQHQIDPAGVGALRTLTGSRYDLVDRNNNIVLEYRKKDLIRLHTASLVTGTPGEQKSLDVSVSSKYGVKQVDWSAAGLIAAGGKIVSHSVTDYDVVLPPWQDGTNAVNTYTVTGVAVDNQNNHSERSDTQVTVSAAQISAVDSTFTPENPLSGTTTDSTLPADGTSHEAMTLKLLDAQKQPVDVPLSDITLTTTFTVRPSAGPQLKAQTATDATVSAFTRKATGVYEATVTAGTKAEMVTLTPSVRKTLLASARVYVIKQAPDGGQSTFAASPKTITADNTAVSTLTLTAKDAAGHALSGLAGSLSMAVTDSHNATPAAGKVTVSRLSESATPGTYTATLTGSAADTYTVKPLYNGSPLGNLSDTVTLTAGSTPDGSQSSFAASPKTLAADNTATSTLILTLKDSNGNAMSGLAGSLSVAASGAPDSLSLSAMSETAAPGIYHATLKGSVAGVYTLTPQFNGSRIGTLSDTVTLTAGSTPDAGNSTFAASPKLIAADNSTTSTLTLTVKDADGNAMIGISSHLSLSVTDSQGQSPAGGKLTVSGLNESATPGTYTASLKGTQAGVWTVTPRYNGGAIGSLSDTVTLTSGTTPDGSQSTFAASPKLIAADNSTTSTLTLAVKDAYGNAVSGMAASLSLTVTGSHGDVPAAGQVTVSGLTESATKGTYTATLKGTKVNTWVVTPRYNGSPLGNLSDTVTLTGSSTPDAGQSAFAAVPDSVVADGVASSTLLLTAKDVYGNAVTGIAASLSVAVTDGTGGTPDSQNVILSGVTETGTPGIYKATLKGRLAGTYTVKPQLNGSPFGSLSDTVTLTAGSTPDGSQSAFAASPKNLAADNSATSTLTLTLKDSNGNAMTGGTAAVVFAVTDNAGGAPSGDSITVSSVKETPAGTYTATLKGTQAGTWTVTPEYNGSAIGRLNDTVILTGGSKPDAGQSTFVASPKNIAADNSATSTLTLTAKDAYGNAISGITANLSLKVTDGQGQTPAADKVTVSAIAESATEPGTYTATLKGTLAGTYTVKPLYNSAPMGLAGDTVTLTGGSTPDGAQSSFVADPGSIVADNAAMSTLTLKAKDANGNPVIGIAGKLSLTVSGVKGTPTGAQLTVGKLTEGSTPGEYSTKLKGTLADKYTVTPQYNGQAISGLSATTVTLTANTTPDGAQSTFSASPKSVAADNEAVSTLTLVVKDAFGNVIPGAISGLTLEIKDSQSQTPDNTKVVMTALTASGTTGEYTATLKGTLAGTYTVKPLLNGSPLGALGATVTLTAGTTPDGGTSAFAATPDTLTADGVAASSLLLTAKDAGGNVITGIASGLSVGVTPATTGVTVSSVTATATPGLYRATLTGTLAGVYTLTPAYNGTAITGLSDTVTLTTGVPDGGKSALTVDPTKVEANGTAASTLTLKLRDAQDNAITAQTGVTFAVTDSTDAAPPAGKVTVSAVTESATEAGTYTATLKGTLAGTYTVKPQVNGSAVGSLEGAVTLTIGAPDGSTSTFSASPHSITADDSVTSTLTLVVKDAGGNALTGKTVTFTATGGGTLNDGDVTVDPVTESADAKGTYTATLHGKKAGTYTVKPQVDGGTLGSLADTVILTAGTTPDGAKSDLTAAPASIVADNAALSTLTLKLRDANGNGISGLASGLSLTVTGSVTATPSASQLTVGQLTESSTPGEYTAKMKGTLADVYTVAAKFNGNVITGLSATTVMLTANTTPDGAQSTFSASPKSVAADNEAVSTLTLVVKDSYGNAITDDLTGLTLKVETSQGGTPVAGDVTVSSLVKSADTAGAWTGTLKGKRSGVWTVKPQWNNAQLGLLSDTVTLTSGTAPDDGTSEFIAIPSSAIADGVDSSHLLLAAKDKFGNVISGLTSGLSMAVTDSQSATPDTAKVIVSSVTETGTPGLYSATLKGTLAGAYTVTPQWNNAPLGELKKMVTLTTGTPDGDKSALNIDPGAVEANGTAASILTLKLRDAQDNAITAQTGVTFAVTDSTDAAPPAGKVTVSAVTESTTAPGTYTATLKGTLAGAYTVKPQVNGSAVGSLDGAVTLEIGAPNGSTSSFSAAPHSPESIVADDTATSLLTLVVKDTGGNAVTGLTDVSFAVTGSGTLNDGDVTVGPVTESATKGTYTATLHGKKADTYVVTPLIAGTQLGALQDTVLLKADTTPDASKSAFTADPETVVADNVTTSTLKLKLKDASSNVISGATGLSLVVTDSGGGAPSADKVTVGSLTELTTEPGTYTATMKGTLAGAYTVKPQRNGGDIGSLGATVTLTAGKPDGGSNSTFSVSPASIVADNDAASTLTLTAKDQYGNAITGIAAKLTMKVTDSAEAVPDTENVVVSNVTESGTPGVYTATLKGTIAGVYTVTPQYDGGDIGSLSGSVTLTAGKPDGSAHSTFSVAPDKIAADNNAASTLTLTLKDSFGNVTSGIAGKLTMKVTDSAEAVPDAAKVIVSNVTESGTTGVYTATLKGTLAGVYTVTPQYDGSGIGSDDATLKGAVTLTTGNPDGSTSSFSAAPHSPESIVADDTATSLLTLVVKDTGGNAVTGLTDVSFAVTGSGTLNDGDVMVDPVTESATKGTYTATLHGKKAGTYTVTPQIGGSAFGTLHDTVSLTAGTTPDGDHSTFVATPDAVAADGLAVSHLLLTVKDAYGNTIGGITSGLSMAVTDGQGNVPDTARVIVSDVTETGTPGIYSATLKGTLADTYTVTPQWNGVALKSTLKDTVTLTAGAPVGGTLSASPATVVADNSPSTLTLTVTDVSGNAVPGLTDSLSFTVTDSTDTPAPDGKVEVVDVEAKAGEPGTYTAILKGTLPGVWTVRPLLSDVALGTVSTDVTLTVGEPDATQSTITMSPKSIKADNTETSTEIIVLKDVSGNAVTGYDPATGNSRLSTKVYGSDGQAVSGSLVTQSPLTESATTPGTYTRTLKGKVVDTLTVRPAIDNNILGEVKDTVQLIGVFKDITANNFTFALDKGFPTTGFSDNGSNPAIPGKPTFTLNMPDGTSGTYTWTSSQDWVTVSAGDVTLGAAGPTSGTKTVMITATSSSGAQIYQYSFTVSTWYKLRANDGVTWNVGDSYCTALGAATPSVAQLTAGTDVRSVGSLWGEWGNLTNTTRIAQGLAVFYKTTDGGSGGQHMLVTTETGGSVSYTDAENAGVGTACFTKP